MKVLIIEDEPISSRRLKRMLMELEPELITEGPAATISEVETILAEEMDYDLIVSDIRLQGRTVFEAFKKRRPQCPVIFTTAYDEFALEAFKHNGIDYLLKPIDIEELSNALRKLGLIPQTNNATSPSLNSFRERLLAWHGDNLIPISVNDIAYFHFDQRHVHCILLNGDNYRIQLSLKELEDSLNPRDYFRLNRQYIVGFKAICRISQSLNSKLCVKIDKCKEEIELSRERSAELRKWLER